MNLDINSILSIGFRHLTPKNGQHPMLGIAQAL